MKILMLSLTYPRFPDDFAGIFIKKLAEAVAEDGNNAVSVLTSSDYENSSNERVNNVDITRTRYFFRNREKLFYRPAGGLPQQVKRKSPYLLLAPFFLLSFFWNTLRHSRKCDVIHCHWTYTLIFAVIPKLLFRKKVIVTARGSDIHISENNNFARKINLFFLKFADGIISVNKDYCESLKKVFPDKKIDCIPNGISVSETPHPPITEIKKLLFVGNVIKDKGIYELITAFSKLDNDISLTIIGKMNDDADEKVKSFIQKNNVNYSGPQSNETVIKEMLKHDLFVFPSHHEGRPNVVMEAMLNGLPVLATKLPGIEEVLDKTEAVLINALAPDELENKIKWCINNPGIIHDFAQKAKTKAKSLNLNWQTCAEKHTSFYKF